MGYPRTLKVDLKSPGYYLQLDTRKSDCNFERTPHWHLYHHGMKIGQITADGNWVSCLNISSSIKKEAEKLTAAYSSLIRENYDYNARNGADYY